MKVIIAGSREFNNLELLTKKCNSILKNQTNIEVVSGTANGADKIGEQYAKVNGYTVKQFPADWEALGKKAGPIRNNQMAQYADTLIVFWNGKSKGTKNMINIAANQNIPTRVILF